MMVQYLGTEFDIPDLLINKYVKDFDGLAGNHQREAILQLRQSSSDILDYVAEDPEILRQPEFLSDFLRALAVRQALKYHGVLYDA